MFETCQHRPTSALFLKTSAQKITSEKKRATNWAQLVVFVTLLDLCNPMRYQIRIKQVFLRKPLHKKIFLVQSSCITPIFLGKSWFFHFKPQIHSLHCSVSASRGNTSWSLLGFYSQLTHSAVEKIDSNDILLALQICPSETIGNYYR